MKLQDFLAHHNITRNPFADEDAQTDPIFQDGCRDSTFHPNWDKIFGAPSNPATSIVFGEKGAGKTAMRLQMAAKIEAYNRHHEQGRSFVLEDNANDQGPPRRPHEQGRLFVVEYIDFNPFLDRFADRLSSRKRRQPSKVLSQWKLWDHMDAILALGVTSMVDRLLGINQPTGSAANAIPADAARRLDRFQKRDLMLLAACYDNSLREPFQSRWFRLRRKMRIHPWQSWGIRGIGWLTKSVVLGFIWYFRKTEWLLTPWPWALIALGWVPWMAQFLRWWLQAFGTSKNLRCITRDVGPLRKVLMQFSGHDINGQPLPNKRRTDDRYELMSKLQGVLKALGFDGILVLVDRVDEPHWINGSLENMKTFIWPMLDNKFLKQPGLGIKLLLPVELLHNIQHEENDFFQRARLDKQNMIPSLEWTGQSLYDLADARVAACCQQGETASLRDLLSPAIGDDRLVTAFSSLRVPRRLLKFLHRLLVTHCQAHVDADPVWQIEEATFESQLALDLRDQGAFGSGLHAP
jgi:hypothetical protein